MGRSEQHPHIVGLGEVAARCGVSRSTVNRNRATLEENGAWKDDAGVWHVPVSALLGLGWTPTPEAPRDAPRHAPAVSHRTPAQDAEVVELRERIVALESRLAVAQVEADKWQAIAGERSLALEDLRRTLHLLEARTHSPEPATPDPAPRAPVSSPPVSEPSTRGVFARLRRR